MPSRSGAQRRLNLTAASDQMLLELTRDGVADAFGELWSRHSGAVIAAVRSFTGYEPDDLMQEAFAKVYVSVTNQASDLPASFRAYVASTARRLAIDRSRTDAGVVTNSYEDELDSRAFEQEDFSNRVLEDSTTAQAFAELPTRQREVLWYRDVEDLPVQEIARYVGMSPNSTTVLIKRARDAFKTAWIAGQLSPQRNLPDACHAVVSRLAKYSRGKLSAAATAETELHLLDCSHCSALSSQADHLHQKLALVLLPLLLLGGAPGYLEWIQSGSNRTPIPAQASYLPVKVIGARSSPVASSGLARPGRRTTYALAAAAATILIAGVAASAAWRLSGGEASSPSAQSDSEVREEVRDEHLRDADSSRERPAAGDERSSAGGTAGADEIDGSDASGAARTLNGIRGEVMPDLVAAPASDQATAPGDPVSSALEPSAPESPAPGDAPAADPPAVTYPTPTAFSYTVSNSPFLFEIRATPGATIYLRAILPRESWANDQWTVVLVADADGVVTYDFPLHRGRTPSVTLFQEYPTENGLSTAADPLSTVTISGLAIPAA